jgi:hypothetical protein
MSTSKVTDMFVETGTFNSFCEGEVETTWGVWENPAGDHKNEAAIQIGIITINRLSINTSGFGETEGNCSTLRMLCLEYRFYTINIRVFPELARRICRKRREEGEKRPLLLYGITLTAGRQAS